MGFDWMRLRTDGHAGPHRAALLAAVQRDEDLRNEGRDLTKRNLLCLCYVLGYTKIDPIIHKEALEFFIPRDPDNPVDQQGIGYLTRGTLLYPRGTYKTTIDEADIVQDVLCFPVDGVLFVMCANGNLANALVDNVGNHFVKPNLGNPTLLQALYPELCVSAPRSGTFDGAFTTPVRRQQPPIKEANVMGWSAEAGVSGWHCWRFKTDDMANNRNMRTPKSQEDVSKNYNVNRKMLMPGGIEDKFGTRYGPHDPYGVELTKHSLTDMRYVVKPALRRKDGARLDPNGFPPREDIELLFEGLGLTYEFLRAEYADYDSFMTQYMNDAHGANEVVFPIEEIQRVSRDAEDMPIEGETFINWRLPAKGLGFTVAAAAVGILDGGRMNIVDAVHGTFRPSTMAIKIVQLSKKWHQPRVEIEETPGARHNEPAIKNYALTLGWPIRITWIEHQDPADRDVRIKSMEPQIAASRVLLSRDLPIGNLLTAQLSTYGMIDDNSLPDVVSRVSAHLPLSIARNDIDESDDDLAWEMMKQRDQYNRLHGAGEYAPQAHEEEVKEEEIEVFEPQANPWGYEESMPGLMG